MMRYFLMICLAMVATLPSRAESFPGKALIQRIFQYASTVDTSACSTHTSYSYTRTKFKVDRKNKTLLLVPSVYAIAHSGQKEYVGETYSRITTFPNGLTQTQDLLRTTTIPRRRNSMTFNLKYLTPRIYDETVIEDYLLSPFNRRNHRFYHYQVGFLQDGTAYITFTPRHNNTKLVTGDAVVDFSTGRIIRCSFSGEYDMIRFWLTIYMGKRGCRSLMPERSELKTQFKFLKNKISGQYKAYYNLPEVLKDSIDREDDYEKMCMVRPDTLTPTDQALYDSMFVKQRLAKIAAKDTTQQPRKDRWVKTVLWDMIGNNLLNRIKTNFGLNNQGYIRLNPILNPLYMGYDHRRGFTYKFDLRTSYVFNSNSEISARFKAGYAFKQRQFFFRIPIYYYFDKQRNSFITLEAGNGNHIQHHSVRKDIEQQISDTTGMHLPDYELLNEFRQNDVRLMINHNLSDKFGFQIGALYQRRTAIHKHAFKTFGWEWDYRSFSPLIQIQYRPLGWNGPIFTADYDRSIKGAFKSNTGYERMEFNGEYILRLNQLRSLQMRVGAGFYTWKDKRAYFLNYENFRENNIPGGWNDDWSGQFELLGGDTYNNSEYYLRSNVTYESPMFFISWVPWLGRYMEMERIYFSILDVKNIHPYMELGYGFTTRLFSCGMFVSNGRGNRTIGFKFGFELFRRW